MGDGAGRTVGDGVGRTVGDEAGTGGTCGCRIASSGAISTPEYATDIVQKC